MALIAAVRDYDELEVLRIMRGYGDRIVDVNQMDVFGNTALHWAVRQSQPDEALIVELLIKAGAKVNVPNEEDQTPIMRACKLGKAAAATLLIEADANVTSTDRDGGTALMKAAFSGHVGIIEMLMGAGGNPELMDKDKQSALHKAARQGHAAACELLVRVGAPVDGRDRREWTPLMHAADQGKGEACAALLKLGADPVLQNDSQNSALELCWEVESRRAIRISIKRAKAEARRIEAEQVQQAMAELERELAAEKAAAAAAAAGGGGGGGGGEVDAAKLASLEADMGALAAAGPGGLPLLEPSVLDPALDETDIFMREEEPEQESLAPAAEQGD
eukprot:SAG22_NODE_3132_length_1911_cov_2.695916_1_plen_334_part_00